MIDAEYHQTLEAFYLAWEAAKTARPSDDAMTHLLQVRQAVKQQRDHGRLTRPASPE